MLQKNLELVIKTGRAWFDAKNYSKADLYYVKANSIADSFDKENNEKLRYVSLLLSYQAQLVWTTQSSSVAFHLLNRALEQNLLVALTSKEVLYRKIKLRKTHTNMYTLIKNRLTLYLAYAYCK